MLNKLEMYSITSTELNWFSSYLKACKVLDLMKERLIFVKLYVLFHSGHFVALFYSYCSLTHCGRMTHICVGNLCQHWFR